jgi:hypothetical protein
VTQKTCRLNSFDTDVGERDASASSVTESRAVSNGRFDAALLQHVAMNIADHAALSRAAAPEVRRQVCDLPRGIDER